MKFMLILWISTIGLERVDLLNGTGDFKLSLFIVLSPLVILSALPRLFLHKNSFLSVRLFNNIGLLFSLLSLFIITIGMSVALSNNIDLSTKRYVLLLYEIIFGIGISLMILSHRDYQEILIKGSILAIIFYLVFTLLQVINWSAITGGYFHEINLPFFDLTVSSFGSYALRNSGSSMDPNRGCFLITIYWFLILTIQDNFKHKRLITIIVGALCISAVSITGMIMFTSTFAIMLFRKQILLSSRQIIGLVVVTILICSFILINIDKINEYVEVSNMLSAKFSIDKGTSNASHIAIMGRALNVSLESFKNILFGNGYGASQNVLADYFQYSKYANFHSSYFSFLAESGILSLLLFVLILYLPLYYNGAFCPLIIGVGLFNIFYQTFVDPIFWVFVSLSWFYHKEVIGVFKKNIEQRTACMKSL